MRMEDKVKKVGLMKEDVVRMCKQLNAESSLFYVFTLEWKNLEEYLDGVLKGIEDRYEEVKVFEREVEVRRKDVELKEGEMSLMKRKIEEYGVKIGSIEKVVEERGDNKCGEEENLGLAQNAVEECSLNVVYKESEATEEKMAGMVKDASGKLERFAEELALKEQEIKSREEYLKGIDNKIRECQNELLLKEKQYASIQTSTGQCSQEHDLKRKELPEIEVSMRRCSDEIESKQKELKLVEESMNKRFEELEMKENSIRSLEASIKEQAEILERKQEQFEVNLKEFEEQKKWLVSLKESIENHERESGSRGKHDTICSEVKEEETDYLLEAGRRKSLQFSSHSFSAQAISTSDGSTSSQSYSQSPQAGKRTKELAKKRRCDYHLPPMGGDYTRKC